MLRGTVASKLRRRDNLQIESRARNNSCGSVSSNSEDERLQQDNTQRLCLAKAIKRNMVVIVATMPFQESENADVVIPDCVNEEECAKLRGLPDRRDQVRALMTLVTKRSFAAMSKVMDIIQSHSPDLHIKIMEQFQELCDEETGTGSKWCTPCMIRNSVDIKDVCDHFYEKSLMSETLYSLVTYSNLKVGAQGKFGTLSSRKTR